jgi:ribonuclease J
VSLVLDRYGTVLAPPQITPVGAVDRERFDQQRSQLEEGIVDAVEKLDDDEAEDDERVRETVKNALRQGLDLARQRRPIVEVQITRLTAEALDALEDDRAGVA